MKKLLIATIALTAVAAPAMAQTWQGKTYADGAATYDITGTVPTFCKFGTNNAAAGLENATDSNRSISLAEGDRTFNITALANPNDNTVQAAAGSFVFQNAVCNRPYEVRAISQNGGLKHTSITTAEAAFVTSVGYGFNMNFGGVNQGHKTAQAGVSQLLVDGTAAHAGVATFRFIVPAQDKLLLEGTYQDTVVLTLAPKA